MITKEQYERLKPSLPVIKMYGKEKVYVGGDLTLPNQIWMELGNPSTCFGCVKDLGNMLQGLYNEIENFERENSRGDINEP